MKRALLIAALTLFLPTAAQARHAHRHHAHHRVPWCGQWLSTHVFHRSIRELWLARNWQHVGRPAPGPAPGVIGVQSHHVFEVIRVVGPGRVLAISGNDNNAVRTRVRSTNKVIAWRAL